MNKSVSNEAVERAWEKMAMEYWYHVDTDNIDIETEEDLTDEDE